MEKANYNNLFTALSKNLDILIQEVKRRKSNLMATDEWTVKDTLCHIVFWHENYAANYKALAENKEAPLLVGPGYKLNKDAVSLLGRYSIKELINRLRRAQNGLFLSIVKKRVPQMTYKKDGHIYKTAEFLEAITRHVLTHANQIKRAK